MILLLYTPHSNKNSPPASPYDDNTPFEPARPLFVDVPFFWAIADGYIDNIITIVLDIKDWVQQEVNAAPLVIFFLFFDQQTQRTPFHAMTRLVNKN